MQKFRREKLHIKIWKVFKNFSRKKSLTNFELTLSFSWTFSWGDAYPAQAAKTKTYPTPKSGTPHPQDHRRTRDPQRQEQREVRRVHTHTISDLEIPSTIEFQIATMPKNGLIPNEYYQT